LKETLEQEYRRLMKELAETNSALNENQKEISIDNPSTADFHAEISLVNLKIKRLREIEEQLKTKRDSH
jgi:hypothetical protein